MKFLIDDEHTGTLNLRIGNSKEEEEIKGLDLDKLYQWYPMNISYGMRYQEPRDRIYLYPVENPPENVDYNYEERMRTKPDGVVIKDIKPDMVCLNVFIDNVELCRTADGLGLPHMLQHKYTLEEAKEGINRLLIMLDDIKNYLELRIEGEELKKFRGLPLQERERMLYSYATNDELGDIKQIGKLYTMINLMRKIAREREGVTSKHIKA